MAGFVSTAYAFGKDIFLYLKGKDKFAKKLDDNFTRLTYKVNVLDGLRKQVQEKADRYEITQEMTPLCKTWLDQAVKTTKKYEILKTRYQKACESMKEFEELMTKDLDSGNFGDENSKIQTQELRKTKVNFFQKIRNPNAKFFKLAKLSKDIVEQTEDVVRVIDTKQLGELLITRIPEQFEMMQADDIRDLPLLYENVKDVLKHLEDEDVKSIGIYAPPGVAIKDLLLNVNEELRSLNKQLNEQALHHNHYVFHKVIWVTVGQEDNVIRKIQKEIGRMFEFPIPDQYTDKQVASMVSRALKKNRYLLILDEVYSEIRLSDVGIHHDHTHGKVVIAAINKLVLRKMKPHREIHVEKLLEDDAWKLFTKYVGDVVDRKRIKDIAELVVKELGGLPLVIKAMGLHLKGECDESIWNNTLADLQSHIESDNHEVQELGGLCSAYKMVYEKLQHEEKKCLLYGALFPRDYEISKDYVVECWRAERFIPDIPRDRAAGDHHLYRAARDKGHKILQDLTGTCLLDWSSSMQYVKMPVIFRKIALTLSYPQEEGCKVLVRAGEGIEVNPEEEQWRDAKRVSLMCNKLKSLNKSLGSSNISTLLLQRNEQLTIIDDSFFGNTRELHLLDLSRTGICRLPSTIFHLSNLKVLYVTGCGALAIIPTEIKRLQNLEVLDICGTSIQYLPSEIQFLKQLRCFRFSYIGNPGNASDRADNNIANKPHWLSSMWVRSRKEGEREIVPPNLIEKLHMLEELTIIVVDHMDQRWNAIADGIAKEVASLKDLTTLCFSFPSINVLETFIGKSRSWNNKKTPWMGQTFRSFNFQVGYHERNHSYCLDRRGNSSERHLKLSSGEPTTSAIRDVLKQTNTFELIGHVTAKNLSDFGMENLEDLEVCVIEACSNMVSVVADYRGVALPRLEKLHIINLQLLTCIHNGPSLKKGSLAKLIVLTLSDCPSLSEILSPGMCRALSQLQHLRVQNCQQISIIIEGEYDHEGITSEEANLSGALHELKTLELVNLPALVSISRNTSLQWRSLDKIEIKACKNLRNLSLTTTNAQQLKLIECDEDWLQALELIEEAVKERLNPLIRCFGTLSEISNHTINGVNCASILVHSQA